MVPIDGRSQVEARRADDMKVSALAREVQSKGQRIVGDDKLPQTCLAAPPPGQMALNGFVRLLNSSCHDLCPHGNGEATANDQPPWTIVSFAFSTRNVRSPAP